MKKIYAFLLTILASGQIIIAMEQPQSDSDTEEIDCSICLQPLDTTGRGQLTCHPKHNQFHKRCIRSWLNENDSENKKCPICMQPTSLETGTRIEQVKDFIERKKLHILSFAVSLLLIHVQTTVEPCQKDPIKFAFAVIVLNTIFSLWPKFGPALLIIVNSLLIHNHLNP